MRHWRIRGSGITIPRIGEGESLNAAVATGIILSHICGDIYCGSFTCLLVYWFKEYALSINHEPSMIHPIHL